MRDHAFASLFLAMALFTSVFVQWDAALAAAVPGPPAPAPTPDSAPPSYAYKGITLGMTADEIRKKLGEPKDRSDAQDLYVFGDEEAAQFLYGPEHKVTAIMITFSGKMTGAPTAKEVFGEDVPARPDGGISKMVRYTKAGYWLSYNKVVGESSIISIAMQKLP